jgi:hypothetical protein
LVAEANSHIRLHGSLVLIGGHPGVYLDALRDRRNKTSPSAPERTPRPKEKFAFDAFVASAGARTPKTIALIAGGRVREGMFAVGEPVAEFVKQLSPGTYFCKPNTGRNGIGAFRLAVEAARVLIDDEERAPEALGSSFSEDYIVQEWLVPLQHPGIARFSPGVINTMRLVTFDTEKGAVAVAGSLRMAIALKSIDSWTQGGVVAAIDLKRGTLKPFGVIKKGLKLVDAHPACGQPFRDYAIPHCDRAVAMACALHEKLGQAKSLGWDIGLLAEGPCIIESNRPWDILMSAQLNPELVPAFLAFHLPQPAELASRFQFHGQFADPAQTCRAIGRVLGASLVSGRIKRFSAERLVLIVGGTKQAIATAVQMFKRTARGFGATRLAVSPSEEMPERGFNVDAVFANARATEAAQRH